MLLQQVNNQTLSPLFCPPLIRSCCRILWHLLFFHFLLLLLGADFTVGHLFCTQAHPQSNSAPQCDPSHRGIVRGCGSMWWDREKPIFRPLATPCCKKERPSEVSGSSVAAVQYVRLMKWVSQEGERRWPPCYSPLSPAQPSATAAILWRFP